MRQLEINMLMQNFLGMGVAAAFGMDPKAGLMAGSVSLTGGLGTTVAWAPIFTDQLGIANATEIGVASSTLGLIAACVVGGPIANHLINRNRLHTSGDEDLDIGQPNSEQHLLVDSYGVLWAWLWLNIALIIGYFLDMGLDHAGVRVPRFVSCLLAGIVISNVGRRILPNLKQYGAAHRAFLLVPLVGGFFIDIINALAINFLANL